MAINFIVSSCTATAAGVCAATTATAGNEKHIY
jgi:hypothetical protein